LSLLNDGSSEEGFGLVSGIYGRVFIRIGLGISSKQFLNPALKISRKSLGLRFLKSSVFFSVS